MIKKYHIRHLEELTGIKVHTIRMWEKRYNLIHPERTDTNIRYYDEANMKKFLLISILYHNKFKISEIAKLSTEQLREQVLLQNKTNEDYEFWEEEMLSAVANFNEFEFTNLIRENIFALGLSKTIIFLLLPFWKRVNLLWMTEALTHLHKEFVFEQLKRFFYSSIHSISKHFVPERDKFILFNDGNEINFFNILFAEIILRKNNFKIISLPNLSLCEILDDIETFNSNKIITSINSHTKFKNDILKLAEENNSTKFFVIDNEYILSDERQNLILINSLEDFEDEVVFNF